MLPLSVEASHNRNRSTKNGVACLGRRTGCSNHFCHSIGTLKNTVPKLQSSLPAGIVPSTLSPPYDKGHANGTRSHGWHVYVAASMSPETHTVCCCMWSRRRSQSTSTCAQATAGRKIMFLSTDLAHLSNHCSALRRMVVSYVVSCSCFGL